MTDRWIKRREEQTWRLEDTGPFDEAEVEGSSPNNVALTICHVVYLVLS